MYFMICVFRYLSSTYDKYSQFLDGSANVEVDNFLTSSDSELEDFGKVCCISSL